MDLSRKNTKRKIIAIWILVILGAFYLYFFQNDFIVAQVLKIKAWPLVWLCAIYLTFGCLRGFTLIPVTYVIVLGLIFLPPLPAYILTIVGVIASSTCIYYFSDYLKLGEYFKRNHHEKILRLTERLEKNELPIVTAWSFMPFLPTDLMCYVCGTLEIDIKKFLIGVFVGEGISCAIYIFLGKDILLFVAHNIFML